MRGYAPSSVPDTNDPAALKDWMLRELIAIGEALPRGGLKLDITYREPVKPRNGMLVYADGTKWDPGSGEGFYGYESGSWIKF